MQLYRSLIPRSLRERISHRRNQRFTAKLRFVRSSAWGLPETMASIDCLMPEADGTQGVNVLGYLSGQFGLGVSARSYTLALMCVGYPVSLQNTNLAVPHDNADRSLEPHLKQSAGAYTTTLVFVNPDHFSEAMSASGVVVRPERIVACWFWELPRVPDAWREAVAEVDEIIVATEFVAKAFRAICDKPVTRIPFPLMEAAPSMLVRKDFGLPDGKFLFLCTFDCNSSLARKNPHAVIEAFKSAFPLARKDVFLLLKSSNGYRNPEALRQLKRLIGEDRRILLRDDIIDIRHLQALQRACDAYVSLHRAEGLGLGMAECMRIGKPVIATGWSGNLDFMNEDNSLLVNFKLVAVKSGEYPNGEGQEWAEPNIMHAATLMRLVVDQPAAVAEKVARARRDIEFGMSPQRSGALLASYLQAHPC